MNNSGVNTIILVLLFGLVVFGLVWFFRSEPASLPQGQSSEAGINLDVNIPTGDAGANTDNGASDEGQ